RVPFGTRSASRVEFHGSPLPQNAVLEDNLFNDEITSLATNEDGSLLAAVGRDTSDLAMRVWQTTIRVWSTKSGKLLARYPSKSLKSREGSPIDSVAIIESEEFTQQIAFSRGQVQLTGKKPALTRLVDLLDQNPAIDVEDPASLKPVFSAHERTWSVRKDRNTSNQFFFQNLADDGGPKTIGNFPIFTWHGRPQCALYFKVKQRSLVAIGYENGILVWDADYVARNSKLADRQTQSRAILRGFYGHEGRVTCLAASSSDAESPWLLSGSVDGTICGWSLAGLGDTNSDQRELGMTVVQQGGETRVQDVDEASPGRAAGFSPGDVIRFVAVVQDNLSQAQWTLGKDQWQSALTETLPGVQHLVKVERPSGKVESLYCFALHEPLFTLYPTLDNDWVLWSPTGHFAKSDSRATRKFGWHVNLNRDQKTSVRFFSGDVFASSYDNARTIRNMIDRKKAIAPNRNQVLPSQIEFQQIRTSDSSRERILEQIDKPEDLFVSLQASTTGNESIQRTSIWCNGVRIREFTGDMPIEDLQIPAKYLRHGSDNSLLGVVESRDDTQKSAARVFGQSSKTLTVVGKPNRKLHYLGVGVTGLSNAADFKVSPLQHAANDAFYLGETLQATWEKIEGQVGQLHYLLDRADVATKPSTDQIKPPKAVNILDSLKSLASEVTADDLLVIFMSGHGFPSRKKGDNEESGFFFTAKDTKGDLSNAVTRDQLYEYFRQMPCSTLLLIDACHSGNTIEARELRDLGELAIGPEIIVSCKSEQSSYEDDNMRFSNGQWYGHGVFTTTLLEALTGTQLKVDGKQRQMIKIEDATLDENSDDYLSIQELSEYAKRRLPQLMDAIAEDNRQDPDFLPSVTFAASNQSLRRLSP
ncbi:MAG: hypothetical protein CMJ78_20075, partial [Planctomycetaceae bacterium]|nr:hypothetical protein [Planctomycetaceae bacterium]